jgi:uncharacterized protein YdeI (YjbR/CyaY-like superfamily)
MIPDNIQFFESSSQFREWLEDYAETRSEVCVGYYKKKTGKPGLNWEQSVEVALCFGWIDGIRKSIDSLSYTIRFTPRNPRSNWSAINIKKVEELKKQGLMKPSGLLVYEARTPERSEIYSFEQTRVEFSEPLLSIFKENTKAWNQFNAMTASYKKTATLWVISAKQEVTQLKRLHLLIADSEKGEKIPPLRR